MAETSPLYIGLDNSTQALKAVVIDQHLNTLYEHRLDFTDDLPEYKTRSGVIVADDGSVLAPVLMYVEAMEKVFDNLKSQGLDFSRVKAVSGAAAQHAIVLLNSKCCSASQALSSSESLKTQLSEVFASPFATNWQDSTTTSQCREMEQAIHQSSTSASDSKGTPGETMAQVTGSSAHERFSGPQLKKVYQTNREVFDKTDRVCILSAFLTTLLCSDGEVKAVDEADASGANLYSIPDRKWNSALLGSIVGADASGEQVTRMMGDVERDPRKSAGKIGKWFQDRYGFASDCEVAYFTGDNPATLLSFALVPGDAVVSLGTSDTVLLATEKYNPHPNYHIFPHPAGDDKNGNERYMGMLCYKNGSLAREMVRDGLNGSSTKSWESFNKAVQDTAAPDLTSGDAHIFGFYFRDHEIIPRNVQGLYRFDANLGMKSEPLNLKTLDSVNWTESDARRILESQFLSFKSKINQLLPADSPSLRRIYVTGGASANPVITSLLSSVLNAPIYAGGSAQGCAMGGAYRAAWCHASKHGDDVEFAEFVKNSRNAKEMAEAEGRVVAQPDRELARTYDALLEPWRKAEAQVIQACAK